MLKKLLLATLAIASVVAVSRADERQLYYSGFNDWTAQGYGSGPVTVTTEFTKEDLTFTFDQVQVVPAGTTVQEGTTGVLDEMTLGYLMSDKKEAYITLSSLKSITRVVFIHSATASKRGYGLQVSVDAGANWTTISNATTSGRGGSKVEVDVTAKLTENGLTVGDQGVMLRFYNLSTSNNAYLTDLWIYGDYTSTARQVTLTTSVNLEGAGSVSVYPPADTYDINYPVTLTATANFGYEFVNWTDANGNELSTETSFQLTLDADKSVVANFNKLELYSVTVNLSSRNAKYTISPEPTDGKLPVGTRVTVTAVDTRVSTFTGWSDGVTDLQRTFTVAGDTELTANFVDEDFIVGWDFADLQTTKIYRNASADDYSKVANQGVINMYTQSGTNTNWLINARGQMNIMKWADDLTTDNRYFVAEFSTEDYENISVESQVLMGYYSFYHTQTLQYSLNGETYTDLATVNYGGAEAWSNLNAALPAECNDQPKVYLRWVSSGEYTKNGKDGTALSQIYVMATTIVENDPVPPSVIGTVPVANSSTASASGTISFTFDKKIQLVDGYEVLLNGKVLTPRVVSNSLMFSYSGLDYSVDYTVTVPAGMVANMSGVATTQGVVLNFTTMTRPVPTAATYDAVVDGSLDAVDKTMTPPHYPTIWQAIEAAPDNSTEPWLIFIKNGYYNDENGDEYVKGVMNTTNKEYYYTDAASGADTTTTSSTPGNIVYVYKPNIHLIGQSRDGVVIAQDRVAGGDKSLPKKHWYDVSASATLVVVANGFYAENLTIDNEWWTKELKAGPQALALYVEADRAAFYNCNIRSYQDTYLSPKTRNTNNANTTAAGTTVRHYYDRNYLKDCTIEGAVDFIYGGGDVLFDGCTLNIVRNSGGYIVAPCHYDDLTSVTGDANCTRKGYVFKNTTITAPGDPLATQVWFGRPWQNRPVTVFIDTQCEVKTYDGIWYEKMGGLPKLWAVYNMWDINGEAMNTTSRLTYYTDEDTLDAKNYLTDEEAAAYTLEYVLAGDSSDNAAVGKWNPSVLHEKTGVPAPVVTPNEDFGHCLVSWMKDDYAICYVVSVNDSVVLITKENEATIYFDMIPATTTTAQGKPAATRSSYVEATVKVQSVNEYGSLSEAGEATLSFPTGVNTVVEKQALQIFAADGNIYVRGIKGDTDVKVYDLTGRVVNSLSCNRNVSFAMPTGTYLVRAAGQVAKVVVK